MYSVKIYSPDLERLEKRFRNTAIWKGNFKELLRKATDVTAVQVRAVTPRVTGELASSIFGRVEEGPKGIVASSSNLAGIIEKGAGRHWPPSSSGLPFPVRRAIAMRGTRGVRMFRRGLKTAKPLIAREVDLGMKKIIADLGFR